MKKLSILYLFAPLSIAAIMAPIILTTTSCSNPIRKIFLTNLGVTNEKDGLSNVGKKFSQMDSNTNFWDLFKGNKNVNNGNYVIFFGDTGTTVNPYTGNVHNPWNTSYFNVNESYKFFNSEIYSNYDTQKSLALDPNSILSLPKEEYSEHSNLLKSIKEWESSKHNNNDAPKNNWETHDEYEIQFFSFILPATLISYVNGADTTLYESRVNRADMNEKHDFYFPASVFSKWTESDFWNILYNWRNNKNDLKNDSGTWTDWEKHHNPSDYLNNTESAKNYRSALKEMEKLMPVTMKDKVDGKAGSTNLITFYYRKGKMNKIDLITSGKLITADLKSIYTKGA